MPDKKVPSPQQLAVANWVIKEKGSLLVEAVAGSGKTSVLINILPLTRGKVAFCSYNKVISEEIKSRVKPLQMGDRLKTGTMHSFGYSAIRAAFPRVEMDGYSKLKKIADVKIKNPYLRTFAINTASMAKQLGIGIFSPIEGNKVWEDMVEHHSLDLALPKYIPLKEGIKEARNLLRESNRQIPKIVDFDDMVYAPALLSLRVQQYDWVLLDEAQDTNPVRRKLVKMMLAPEGRLIAVGDSHQAINGYTGADHNSMNLISEEFNTKSLPLSVTFRCPKAIVDLAHNWVNHIEAHESAPEGEIDSVTLDDFILNTEVKPDDAILCRVTRPLVELAFKLIQRGTPCKVEGRAIGEGLIKLINKLDAETISDLEAKVLEWKSKSISKFKEEGKNSRCEEIEDQAETLRVLIDQCDPKNPVSSLIDKIKNLFGDSKPGQGQSMTTLSTIHRAKGKEWDHVYILGLDKYSPSKWAKKEWELIQEKNLCYVQITRAKKHLTLVHVETF